MITKSQVSDWKFQEITQQLMDDLEASKAVAIGTIAGRREPNQDDDQFLRGFIRAIDQILDWEPEYEEAGNE